MDLDRALAERRRVVDEALAQAFGDIQPATLREATRWYPDAGGKRLRPVMTLLASEAAGGSAESALPFALAVEMVHNFSLVHDDIMDRDATRRGRPTVHVKWGEATAILAGDVLFARAFQVLPPHREATALLSKSVLGLCEGQALDMEFETRDNVSVADYLEMIRLKTALLFECATKGGALLAGDHADTLGKFGEAFGMAFQIADDVLDATADEKTLGKPWGSDIRAGKRTLLVLDAVEHGVKMPALGQRDATDAQIRETVNAMRDAGCLGRAAKQRDDWAKRADDSLRPLPKSEARDALLALNTWATTRAY